MTRGMVIVETRILPNLRDVLMNHYKYTGWPLTIFHGRSNGEFVRAAARHLPNTIFELVSGDISTGSDYNALLTDKKFWEVIKYGKVLVFQHDSLMLRSGIEEFMQYDYVGAPWKFQLHGGNGGLSLRNREAMIKILSQSNELFNCNEDVWFCNYMYKNGMNLAPRNVCEEFSCETIFKTGTMGCHAISRYLNEDECNLILNQYTYGNKVK